MRLTRKGSGSRGSTTVDESSNTVSQFENASVSNFDVVGAAENLGNYSSEVTSQSLVRASYEPAMLPIWKYNVNLTQRRDSEGNCSPVGLRATAVT